MSHDIAFTLHSLGMVQNPEGSDKPLIVIDWSVVDAYMKKAASNETLIKIDPECLRWTPLISPVIVRQPKEVINIYL